MERDLDKIMLSQRVVLARSGKEGARLAPEQLRAALARQLHDAGKLLDDRRAPMIRVNYRQCVEDAAAVAAQANGLLEGTLNFDKMASAVVPELHRRKVDACSL